MAALAGVIGLLLVCAATVLALPPTVTVSVAPNVPQAGREATFTAKAADPDGPAAPAVAWDFDGNGVFDAQGASVKHTFATGGNKTVTVRVTDAAAEVTQVQRAVSVNTPPVVSTDHSPASPRVGQTVSFELAGQRRRRGQAHDELGREQRRPLRRHAASNVHARR